MLANTSLSRKVLTVTLGAAMAIGLCSGLVDTAQAGGRPVYHNHYHGHVGYRHVGYRNVGYRHIGYRYGGYRHIAYRGHRFYGHRPYGYRGYYGYIPATGYVATEYVPVPTYSSEYVATPAPNYVSTPSYVTTPNYTPAPAEVQTPAPAYQAPQPAYQAPQPGYQAPITQQTANLQQLPANQHGPVNPPGLPAQETPGNDQESEVADGN